MPIDDQLQRTRRMYVAALRLYVEECRSAYHDRRNKDGATADECMEAFIDLCGPRTQLNHLADMLGLDRDKAFERINRDIESPEPFRRLGAGGARSKPAAPRHRPFAA